MKMIVLTNMYGTEFFLNVSYITMIEKNKIGSVIYLLNKEEVVVKENPEEIIKKYKINS